MKYNSFSSIIEVYSVATLSLVVGPSRDIRNRWHGLACVLNHG